jgi:hypothetical protein
MYKLFLPFLLLSSVYLSGQVHSKELSSTSKLALTCKVWGLLKYYHPVVAKEDTGWDDQLFQKIPQILETKSEVEFFDLIDNWINDFGDITSRKQIVNKDQKTNLFEANINLDWIDSLKNKRPFLFEKLKSVKEHRVKGKRYYVKKGSVNQVEIINERSIKPSIISFVQVLEHC